MFFLQLTRRRDSERMAGHPGNRLGVWTEVSELMERAKNIKVSNYLILVTRTTVDSVSEA